MESLSPTPPDHISNNTSFSETWREIVQPFIAKMSEQRTRGLIYDFGMGSIAAFLLGLLLLNFLAGEQARGFRAASRRTAELHKALLAWQDQLRQERQLLAKQWMLLESDLAEIPGATHANSVQPDQIRGLQARIAGQLERWSVELAEWQTQLAQLAPGGDAARGGFNPARQQQENALNQRIQEMFRSQQELATQLTPNHPRLQAGLVAIQETQLQLERLRSSPTGDLSASPVRVIQNQFIHNAGLTAAPTHSQPIEQFIVWSRQTQQTIANLRNELAVTAKAAFVSPAQHRQLRDTAIMFSEQLESWEAHARLPLRLARMIESESSGNSAAAAPQLELSGTALTLLTLAALASGGAVLWFGLAFSSRSPVPLSAMPNPVVLSVAEITNALGSAPLAILPSLDPPSPQNEPLAPAAPLDFSAIPSSLPRRACEVLVWMGLAATLALIFVHDRFGGWVQENPLTAWGRWWGGE